MELNDDLLFKETALDKAVLVFDLHYPANRFYFNCKTALLFFVCTDVRRALRAIKAVVISFWRITNWQTRHFALI